MLRDCLPLAAGAGFVVWLCGGPPAWAQTAPPLGSAASFAVLGATTVTNTGATTITGELGVSPGTAVTGFPPGVVVSGTIHANDGAAVAAQASAAGAYNSLVAETCTENLTGQDLGGKTLTAGVYCFDLAATLAGTLTLDARGSPNAVFIFKMGTTITAGTGSSAVMINGGVPGNVFWQVGSSATLGVNSSLVGNVLAFTSITMNGGATLIGRLIAQNAAITLDTNTVTVPASVTLSKAFTPTSLAIGGTTRLTFTLSNTSTSAQNGLTFTDTLPSGLVVAPSPNVSNSCTGTVNASGAVISLASGVAGASGACTIAVDVTNAPAATTPLACPAPSLTNGVSNISGLSLNLATASGFGACVDLVQSANISISKTPPATLVAGQTVVYTLTVHNAGPSPAENVIVTDTLPAPLTFVSSTPTCTTGGQTVTCNLGTLTSGQTTPIALNVHVAPDVQAGTIISNTASVGATTADPDPSNNTSSSLSPGVTTSADLSTTKTALGASVTPGATFTYRIVVTNNGPSTASNVSVTDPLPSLLTFISSPSGCTAAGQNVTCGTLAQIAPSASQTFDIVVALDPAYTGNGSDIGNVATASSPTPDPTPGNNASTPAAPPLVNTPSANLSLTKAAVEPNVSAGETFTYRIVVANAGPSTAANVAVTDTLPSQLAFVSSPHGCTAAGQNVTCPNVAALAPSADTTVDLVVRLDPAYTGNGSDIGNVAIVTSATVDSDSGNNSNPPAPPPAIDPPKSDVQIVKSVSSAAVLPGQMFTYTLRATNNGPAVATNVVVTDTLPSQVTFTSSAAGCTAVGQNVTCPTSATLTVGADATFDIVVTLSPSYVGNGGDVLNSGFVTSTTTDPAPSNNTSPGGAPPPVDPSQSDVAIVKSVSTTTVPPGGTFTYSLLVSNQGPSDATSVAVTDTLATGVTFVSSAEGCTAVAQDVTCPTVATLIPGASQTFTFVARLDAGYTGNGSDLPNTGTVATTTADPVPANNTSNTVFPPVGGAVADVSMAKAVLETSVTPGGTFTYHLTVSNAGPSTATDVAVTDVLPAPLAFVSSPQSCTATGQNVTCPMVATLAAGATSTFDLVVRLDPSYTGNGSDIGNVANVNTTTTDPDPSNNTNAPPVGPPSVGPPSADLVTTKAAIESSVTPGGTFTYQVLVTNNGPSTATIVQVTDPLPLALAFVSSPSGCTAPAQTVTCGPTPSLLPGASATFAFVVRLSAAYTGNGSDLGNVASVTSFTPDPNTTNNSNAPAPPPTVGAPDADLSLTKVSVEANVTPGQTFTYQIVVMNGGPSIATDVVLSDTLPGPLAFVSSSSLGCTAAGQVVTCPPLVSLAVGASTTVTLVVRLDPDYTGNGSDLGNIASVSSATNDPNPGDNANPPAPPPNVGPPQSDVQMVKSVSSATVLPGERHTYTLHVTNNGPSVAANVVVTDTLPPAVTFVSSPEGCTAATGVGAHSITCPAIATLAVGAGTTFDLVVQLSPSYAGDGSDVLNGALVMSATADPATSNNSSQAGAPPVGSPAADLTVVKNVSAAPVTPGDTFTYTVMVSNQGPSDATNVVVTDPLPVGVIWVSSAEGCTAAGQNVTCPTISTLAPGAWRTFTIVARLDQSYAGNGSDLENRATVTSATGDPVPGNNTSAPATPVVGTPSADLSATKTVVDTHVLPGQNFTYRITVANAGPSTAHGVTVTDPLPSQTIFVYSPSGCTAVGQIATCPPVSLAVGASATFDIVVQLSPAYTGDGADIINTATVSAATNDPAPQNNSNPPAAPLVGTGEADLTITKIGPDGSVPPGGEITYTIVVTNQGPNAANDIVIQDPTPAGLTFIATEGACATAFPCALGTMLPGQAKTIAVRYAVPSTVTGVLTNTATISSSTPDPSLANNAATAKTPPDPITYYLAEGATGTFWDEDVLIANPNAAPAPVTMTFLKESGEVITKTLVVAPMSRVTVHVDDQPGLEATSSSTEITSESGLPLAVERTMTWDATAYGGHTETAVTQTATRWYFAEGAQGYFDVYLLLGNPNAAPANVTLTFLREADTPVVKTLSIGAHARLTVHAGGIPELVDRSFGIVVDATQPVVAERSMYFGTTATRLWGGGHASAGVTEPSRRWFYAEGATGSFFDTFILLSNPQTIDADVKMEYILPSGEVITAAKLVPAQGRVTVSIDNEADARLHAAAVSTRITSDVPIVTERSMYWYTSPDVLPWSAGHNSFGVDQTAPRWGLAEGRVGGPHNFHTYILLANPWMATAEVTVTYVREAGAPLVKTYTVPPTTRYTIDVKTVVPELRNETFGAAIAVTNGLTISVERSLYWDANGVFWTAGTNAAATKLP